MKRGMIYTDDAKGIVELSINEHYVDTFIKCLHESNYWTAIKGDGAQVIVRIRRDDE